MMKKAIIYWFVFLIILLIVSCKTVKEQSTKEKYVFDSTQVHTNKLVLRSLEINDYFKKGVPYLITNSNDKNCDSLCNAKFIEWLKSWNVEKQSGKNSYKLAYDELTKQVSLNVKIGETVSELKDSIAKLNFKLINTEKQYKQIPVEYIPKYVKILAFIGFISLVLGLIFILKKFNII